MALAVEGKTGEIVWELYDDVCQAYEEGNYNKMLEYLYEMWELIPDNKFIYAESWVVVSKILDFSIEYGDKETMVQWIDKIEKAVPDGYTTGDRECYKGKVAYELGDFENAREYLSYANKKSRGRCFGEDDKKYLEFLSQK